MTPADRRSPLGRVAKPTIGVVVSGRTWLAAIHVVLSPFVAIVPFVVIITGLALSIGLVPTVVLSLPVLWLTLLFTDGFAHVERARFRAVLGVDIPDVRPPPPPTVWGRVGRRLVSGSSWKRATYALTLLPVSLIGLAVVVGSWAGALTLVVMPAVMPAFPDRVAHFGLFEVHPGVVPWLATALGLVGLVAAGWLTRGTAELEVLMGRGLLGLTTTAVLEQRVDTLETTRAQAVQGAEAERRRIERDLHDGAQQRLVALAMDLGMAREKFDVDPDGARALIDRAHHEAKLAMVELRDLAKGIHPVALTDRGLPGAIPGLADRVPLPVEVWVDVPRRPSPAIEGMAYFIVSESLANVAKHAGATHASVDVEQHDRRLFIRVTDDGAGGADPRTGSGLQGLAERASSVDGRFEISSPVGGPTIVRAELPCES